IASIIDAEFMHAAHQASRSYTGNGWFAGAINIQHVDTIATREAAGQFIQQELGARISVRLEYSDEALGPPQAGGVKRGANLRRVVAVVINDGDTFNLSLNLKAPIGGAKPLQAAANLLGTKVQFESHGNRRQGVLHVMPSGNRNGKSAEILPFYRHVEHRSGGSEIANPTLNICARLDPVSHHPAAQLGHQSLHQLAPWHVEADHHGP